jgi:hypothetical protein
MKKSLIATAVTGLALALAGPAAAGEVNARGWTNYAGKTKEGGDISFAYKKGRVMAVQARIHTTCGTARGGNPVPNTSFDPPANIWFRADGRESQLKYEASWPTRYYTVAAKKRGKRVVGKLRLSWSFYVAYGTPRICFGTANFNLKPKK